MDKLRYNYSAGLWEPSSPQQTLLINYLERRGETSFYSPMPGKQASVCKDFGVGAFGQFPRLLHQTEVQKKKTKKKTFLKKKRKWDSAWSDIFPETVFRLQLFSKGKCDASGKHLKRKGCSLFIRLHMLSSCVHLGLCRTLQARGKRSMTEGERKKERVVWYPSGLQKIQTWILTQRDPIEL